MFGVRRSPLFRIALLSLAVLFTHTARATNVEHSFPATPPCARKVAAAQPDPEKKLSTGNKQIVMPGRLTDRHNIFGYSFGFTNAYAASLLPVHGTAQIALARSTASITPQRRPFALRI